jgi:hypothetical protein
MLHAATIALGACLLFLIQPLLGRQLLPCLGGSAGVWTACLLTFQTSLLVGYLYADRMTKRLSATVQRRVHLALLAVSLLFLPVVTQSLVNSPPAKLPPTLAIVVWILVSAGLPLLLLCASSPLLSVWYRQTPGSNSVYRLYALSNAGSLIAVFGYPFLIEPFFTLQQQRLAWSAGYTVFVLMTAVVAVLPRNATSRAMESPFSETKEPARWLWFALAMCGTAMLTSTTNLISQEISVVPFLWLAPLGIYLFTLIATFDHPRWYRRKWWMAALALTVLPQCAILYVGAKLPFAAQAGISLMTLLAACFVCHGELSCARPAEGRVTDYYLVIAAGGCVGGLFVAVLAPMLFSGYWEYGISLWSSCLLAATAGHRNRAWNQSSQPELRFVVGVGLVALAVILVGEAWAGDLHSHITRRSFYGVLRLIDGTDDVGPYRKLAHGRIAHGLQYVAEDKLDWATLYYGRRSAVGITFDSIRAAAPGPLRVGLLGMGIGTTAAYGSPGDVFRFYELNTDVDWFARQHFSLIKRSPAHVETIIGDARLTLEREFASAGSQEFDLLFVDAFRNDAVPVHLLTRECGETYFRHLKDDGVLLFHISNRFVDLEPVVRGLAAAHNCPAVRVHAGFEPERGAESVTWMVVTRNAALRERLAAADETSTVESQREILWTDDFSALWPLLK